ncbi:hypothetical protein F8566_22190 [Actinomadura rudentiformis]|uniref:Uncharacterized protein n=1 Tax=Actinomadura rudentiformis TaxID=359158 RepID=A0A6H9Z1Q9_9ACTN|nr:hypothetical protein F8566_22190 [Actinomadura rudentiformis]
MDGALAHPSRELMRPDEQGQARLLALDQRLAAIRDAFPFASTDTRMCRLACELLESAWRQRAEAAPVETADSTGCTCLLCSHLPTPPPRRLEDYDWRKSAGAPLLVKTWPYRRELDSVLSGGWAWTRKMSDSDHDLGLRFRNEDDILVFQEYKRVANSVDISGLHRKVGQELTHQASTNGARALVSGLYATHKRAVDEYWLTRHTRGAITLPQANPLDKLTYALLQTLDCLFWHVPPEAELWQEGNLASLVLCRVLDDMTDTRADAVTGEISNFWLGSVSTHDKAMYAASAIALVKYGCMPESHGVLWNTWLMDTTIVWMALTGRHALWFDGIIDELPPLEDCPLCGIEPNSCTGLLSGGITLKSGPQIRVNSLSSQARRLSNLCRTYAPDVWRLFDRELAAFEALHGEWHGDLEITWKILSRTYVAAVRACLAGGNGAREVQLNAGAVGAELFHALNAPPTWKEDTALLAYMFGCAHPHFLWNCVGYRSDAVAGDELDG